ncbi:MAG: AP2/ERF family transcription factor [archaeon]
MNFKDITKNIAGVKYNNKNGVRFFSSQYKNTKKGVNKRKYFHIKKYGARKAFQLALNHRKELEEKYGLPTTHTLDKKKLVNKNKIEIEKDYFYLKVIHKETGQIFKVKLSLQDLAIVQNQYWYIDLSGRTPGEAISTYHNGQKKYLSKILFPDKKSSEVINHINRDLCDFTRENSILDSCAQYINAPKYRQSNEAIPGVCYYIKKNAHPYWKASYSRKGYSKTKWFSIKKFGYEEAKRLAEEKRRNWERELA